MNKLANIEKNLKCKVCGREYQTKLITVCEECFGPLEVVYEYPVVQEVLSRDLIGKRNWDFWRYSELLPVGKPETDIDLRPGFTPLRRCRNLERLLNVSEIFVKDETVNPTYSFKDRAAAIGVLKSREYNLSAVGCASTGNLANATAAAAARAAIPCYVFVPSALPPAKILVTQAFGARIIGINGPYDEANRIANRVADRFGWGLLNINVRPYYVEGSKTISFEIIEQLRWRTPDRLIIPLGSGALLSAVDKGIREFESINLISESEVRICGTQPEGCSPIATAYINHSKEIIPVENPKTIAESLAIGDPASGHEALDIIADTGGFADAPSDEEIRNGQNLLARTEGIFTEPAGGTVVASLLRKIETGEIDHDETIVLLITGSGFKTIDSFVPAEFSFPKVPSTLEAVEKALGVI